MRKFTFINLIIASILILASCSTSNSVVSNRLISKRKYTKGFHINKKSDYKASKDAIAEREEVENKSYDVTSTTTTTTTTTKKLSNDVVEIPPVQFKEIETIEESSVTEKMLSKSNKLTVTEEKQPQSQNQNVEGDFQKTVSQKEIIESLKKSNSAPSGDVMLVILIILAIIIPPLAVFIYEGATSRFWIDLILAILGWGAFGLFGGVLWLAGLAAVIYALLIVLEVI